MSTKKVQNSPEKNVGVGLNFFGKLLVSFFESFFEQSLTFLTKKTKVFGKFSESFWKVFGKFLERSRFSSQSSLFFPKSRKLLSSRSLGVRKEIVGRVSARTGI